MKKYNVYYKTKDKTIEKTNITEEELSSFLDSIETEQESLFKVKQIKDREEER